MRIRMPFYPNTKDNTHCYQAWMRMALKKIMPEKEFTYNRLEAFRQAEEQMVLAGSNDSQPAEDGN